LLFFSGIVFDVDVGDGGAAAPCDDSVVIAMVAVVMTVSKLCCADVAVSSVILL
jgi:hypothetical protein